MFGKVIVRTAINGELFVTVTAKNGRKLLHSETYASPSSARRLARKLGDKLGVEVWNREAARPPRQRIKMGVPDGI